MFNIENQLTIFFTIERQQN